MFPPQIKQVKTIVMKMVYPHKQLQLENMVEALQEMAMIDLLQKDGLSFCITKYQTRQHEVLNCTCTTGFSITCATVDLSRWHGNFPIGCQEVSIESLFENGLLSKLTITHPRQLNSINLPWWLEVIVQDLLSTRPLNIGFAVLELFSVPPNYQTCPCEAQHSVLINLVRYGTPEFLIWQAEQYKEYFISMNLSDKLKEWRAYAQAFSNKLHRTSWLIAEEVNLEIFTTYELKHFQIPMRGTLISNMDLVEHYKQIRAHWCTNDVEDNRITMTQEMSEAHDDMLEALDDIGIMNLENTMEG